MVSLSTHILGAAGCNKTWPRKGEWKQKVLKTTIPMRHPILYKNTLVFSQNSLAVSSMIYKYQDLGWKADVHVKKGIFSQKNPNPNPTLHQREKKKKEEAAP